MTRYKERYHQAARDNYLDLLREATRNDSDAADENGMSPVLWAAFYGNLEALRLLISRGGNPDKTDNMGGSALHFASLNGHMPCVTFLVNFGANIWIMDNDLHTALDLASLRDHQDIVDYLDGVASQQYTMNKRVVAKMKEKAAMQAQKRIKKYNRLLKKTSKKAAKDDKRQQAELLSESVPASAVMIGSSSSSAASAASVVTTRRGHATNPNYQMSSQHQQHHQQQQQQQRNRKDSSSASSQRAYSEYLTTSRSSRPRSMFGAAKKIVGHRRLGDGEADNKSHDDVVYVRSDTRSVTSGPTSEPDLSGPQRADSGFGDSSAGLFERPGFGSVAFFSQNQMTRTLNALKVKKESREDNGGGGLVPSSPNYSDSIGTSGSLVRRWRDLPWSEEDVENLDDDNDTLAPHTELELFLACLGVTEYMHAFTAERIDLEALGLCTDRDLHDLGLPLGPRKKILEGLQRRKEALAISGSMQDLRL